MVCPQKLDERNKRVKTDGLDAKALSWTVLYRAIATRWRSCACPLKKRSKLEPFIGSASNWWGARKRLEAQGRSLLVNHGLEPVQNWWKPRTFATLTVPQWMRELLLNSQPILLALQKGEHALQEIKILLERGRRPVPNLLRMPFVCVGLDWARPKFLFHLIAY